MMVNFNHIYNTMKGVFVDGCWIDDPGKVKEEICLFFKKRFEEVEWERPKLDEVRFQVIDHHHSDLLMMHFDEKEVKVAV